MTTQGELKTAEDVTQDILDHAEEVEETWFSQEAKIDWYAFWDRFDTDAFWLEDMDGPAARKIQAHIRAIRRGMS